MPPMVVVGTDMVVPVDSFDAVVVIGSSLVLLSVVCPVVPCVEVIPDGVVADVP